MRTFKSFILIFCALSFFSFISVKNLEIQAAENGIRNFKLASIAIVGLDSAGKTALLNGLTGETDFDYDSKIPTKYININPYARIIRDRNGDNCLIRCHFIEVTGRKEARSDIIQDILVKELKNAFGTIEKPQIVLLLVDMDPANLAAGEDFGTVAEKSIYDWQEAIRSIDRNIKVILVGTKFDTVDDAEQLLDNGRILDACAARDTALHRETESIVVSAKNEQRYKNGEIEVNGNINRLWGLIDRLLEELLPVIPDDPAFQPYEVKPSSKCWIM